MTLSTFSISLPSPNRELGLIKIAPYGGDQLFPPRLLVSSTNSTSTIFSASLS